MKNQKGFGIFTILGVLVILGLIGGTGWHVYARSRSLEKDKANSQQTQNHEYKNQTASKTPNIDTSSWNHFEPFTGFKLKYPTDWKIIDTGFTQQAVGVIDQPSSLYLTVKSTYLLSPDIVSKAPDYPIDTEAEKSVEYGARIQIDMTKKDAAYKSFPNDLFASCDSIKQYYKNNKVEEVTAGSNKACRAMFDDNVYVFYLSTNNTRYDVSLKIGPQTPSDRRDHFIELAKKLIETFQLY